MSDTYTPKKSERDTAPEGCPWLVERQRHIPDEAYEDGWFPDSPSDLVEIVPCGGVVDPDSRHGMCSYHRGAMEMDDLEFERAVEAGRSWS